MTEKELVTLLETEYLAKILGFCYQKLNDREAAWTRILSEHEKTVPKHLHGQKGNFLSNRNRKGGEEVNFPLLLVYPTMYKTS